MNKKLIFIVLLFTFFCACLSVTGQSDAQSHITVASTTPMSGQFFTDLWGDNTSDIDVRDLLHAYNLVIWDNGRKTFVHDPSVVSGLSIIDDVDGNIDFMFILYNDLMYSNGSKITAWDYAFSFLFQTSPLIAEIGGVPAKKDFIVGYDDYFSGKTPFFSGIRVLTENTLMIKISRDYLPMFYEMFLLECNPYPISVIAPSFEVKDDGDGAYIYSQKGSLSAELLRETILDPENGYFSHPSVVSGPYKLSSWDGHTAEFSINPYYKGNKNGYKPEIQNITYRTVSNEDAAAMLKNGEIDIFNKAVHSNTITEIIRDIQENGLRVSNYPRTGLSMISFSCENPTVESSAVRQAIAWSLDRDLLTEDYTSYFGLKVDGFFSIGHWVYRLITGADDDLSNSYDEMDTAAQVEYEKQLEIIENLSLENLTKYTADVVMANVLLDVDGWKLNSEGVREKVINGKKVTLDLLMIYPEENNIVEFFEKNFIPKLEEIGIRLRIEPRPMEELLSILYGETKTRPDMIFYAFNFGVMDNPSDYFSNGDSGEHYWFNTYLDDEELYNAAIAMRKTNPGNIAGYMQQWVRFQERFNLILPAIPLYSNTYFDFYNERITNYSIAANSSWAEAIVEARLK